MVWIFTRVAQIAITAHRHIILLLMKPDQTKNHLNQVSLTYFAGQSPPPWNKLVQIGVFKPAELHSQWAAVLLVQLIISKIISWAKK